LKGNYEMKSILRYPGSKWNLADKISQLLPEHKTYLEPYFGSGAVLFTKSPSAIETVNDLNDDVVNLFRVIQQEPEALAEKIYLTPYSRKIYDEAWKIRPKIGIDKALNFVIRSVMSHGFRVIEKSGWKMDVNGRERAYAVKHWNDLPKLIQEMTLRLKQVQIECRPAIELIEKYSREDVCMYVDPPYVLSTRTRKQYSVEMEDKDHEELLDVLNNSDAKILLSGYDSDLYNKRLTNWERIEFSATAEKGLPRTEILWVNFSPKKQLELF
jgi:nitrogenase moFe cofactor biosynthesis protein nifE